MNLVKLGEQSATHNGTHNDMGKIIGVVAWDQVNAGVHHDVWRALTFNLINPILSNVYEIS